MTKIIELSDEVYELLDGERAIDPHTNKVIETDDQLIKRIIEGYVAEYG